MNPTQVQNNLHPNNSLNLSNDSSNNQVFNYQNFNINRWSDESILSRQEKEMKRLYTAHNTN